MAKARGSVGHGFMEFGPGTAGKIYLHNTQDLSSGYKFLSMAGGYPIREEVAGYLSEQFDCGSASPHRDCRRRSVRDACSEQEPGKLSRTETFRSVTLRAQSSK
jgi:hypothetical protein